MPETPLGYYSISLVRMILRTVSLPGTSLGHYSVSTVSGQYPSQIRNRTAGALHRAHAARQAEGIVNRRKIIPHLYRTCGTGLFAQTAADARGGALCFGCCRGIPV